MDLVLDNGERIQVRHPEAVFFIADWEIVVVDDGRAYFIGPEAVSMIVRSRSRRRKSPTR